LASGSYGLHSGWNDGILEKWVSGNCNIGKMAKLESTTESKGIRSFENPPFHYSNIPLFLMAVYIRAKLSPIFDLIIKNSSH